MKLVNDNPDQLELGIEIVEVLERRHISFPRFAKYYVMNAYHQAINFKRLRALNMKSCDKRGVGFVPMPNNLPEPSFMANAQTTLQEPEFMKLVDLTKLTPTTDEKSINYMSQYYE